MGSHATIKTAANANVGSIIVWSPANRATTSTPNISVARVTGGAKPDKTAYITTATAAGMRNQPPRLPNRNAAAYIANPPTIATCSPEIASRWDNPAPRNLFTVSIVKPPRSPVSNATPRAPASPGTSDAMLALIAARNGSMPGISSPIASKSDWAGTPKAWDPRQTPTNRTVRSTRSNGLR